MPAALEREASRLFSTAVFRSVATGRSAERADAAACRLRGALNLGRDSTNRGVVAAAYDLLRRNYRSEYFYRNLIASKLYVGRHRTANSALLNELRVGDSVADCVLVNGSGVVYEIKTEFDTPQKLRSQLGNYYRAFPYVNVVAHASEVTKYARVLEGTPTGLIGVGARDRLSVVKPAERETGHFEVRTMFNLLRANEAAAVLDQWYGRVEDVPNGLRYQVFLGLAERIPAGRFQTLMERVLKTRSLRHCRQMILRPELLPLRALMVQLDPDARQQDNLTAWLDSKGT
jgi:hypothetical protein